MIDDRARSLPHLRPLVGLLVLALLAGLIVIIPASPAAAAPIFKLPFRCGEVWHAGTYPGHSPDVDWNAYPSDYGRPVLASASGTVRVGMARLGEMWIDHGGGWSTRYLHMENRPTNLNGRYVSVGTRIGTVGPWEGAPTSPHLHYEQRYGDVEQPVAIDGVRISVGGTNAGAPRRTPAPTAACLRRVDSRQSSFARRRHDPASGAGRSTPTFPPRRSRSGPTSADRTGPPGYRSRRWPPTSAGPTSRPRTHRPGPITGSTPRSPPASAGTQPVCVYALNVGSGSNTLLGCRSVTVAGDVTVTVGYTEADHQLLVRAARHAGQSVEEFTRDATIILAFLVYISDPSDARPIRPVPSTTGPRTVTVTWPAGQIPGVDGIGRFFSLDRPQSQRASADLFTFLALLDGA